MLYNNRIVECHKTDWRNNLSFADMFLFTLLSDIMSFLAKCFLCWFVSTDSQPLLASTFRFCLLTGRAAGLQDTADQSMTHCLCNLCHSTAVSDTSVSTRPHFTDSALAQFNSVFALTKLVAFMMVVMTLHCPHVINQPTLVHLVGFLK